MPSALLTQAAEPHESPSPDTPAGAQIEDWTPQDVCRSPRARDYINTRVPHSGSSARNKGDSRNHVCRIFVFMWSFGPLVKGFGSSLWSLVVLYASKIFKQRCISNSLARYVVLAGTAGKLESEPSSWASAYRQEHT